LKHRTLHIWDKGFETQPGNQIPKPCLTCLIHFYLNADHLPKDERLKRFRIHRRRVLTGRRKHGH